MDQAPDYAPVEFLFSSGTLPGSDPVAAMKEYVGREIGRCEIDLADDEKPFEYRIAVNSMAEVTWGRVSGTPMAMTRTPQLLADGADDLMLVLADNAMQIEDGKTEIAVRPGDAFMLSLGRVTTVRLLENCSGWSMRLPRRPLAAALAHLGEAPFMHLPQTTGLTLLRNYLRLLDAAQIIDPALRSTAGRHVQDLSALVVGASRDYAEQARLTSAATVRMQVIQADMEKHLGHPGLDLGWLSRRHGLSPRQIQRLFAARDTSFSEQLRWMRVSAARRMLEDPREVGRPVIAIALDCGFPEASALNRAFRQAFGIRPTDVRPAGR